MLRLALVLAATCIEFWFAAAAICAFYGSCCYSYYSFCCYSLFVSRCRVDLVGSLHDFWGSFCSDLLTALTSSSELSSSSHRGGPRLSCCRRCPRTTVVVPRPRRPSYRCTGVVEARRHTHRQSCLLTKVVAPRPHYLLKACRPDPVGLVLAPCGG